MIASTATARDLIGRIARRAGERLAASKAPRRALAAATGFILVSLTGVGGTAALWTGSVTVDAPTITAGSINADITDFSALNHTYTVDALSRTAGIALRNTGSVEGSFTVTMTATGSATMANNVALDMWMAGTAASCTEHESVGAYGWSGALTGAPAFTGTFPANATAYLCIRTRLTTSQLATTATISPKMTLDLAVPNTSWSSSKSATATQNVVANGALGNDYTDAVRADGAEHYWPLGEQQGRVLYDWIGTDDAYAGSGITRGATGALLMSDDDATTFPNDSTGAAGTRVARASQNAFAVEAWFKTTSRTGGKIVGFGSSSSGLSSSYDRHIYMDTTGAVVFGVWPNASSTITTPKAYNDGQWHHVVGNLGPRGQEFYIDGQVVGRLAAITSSVAYNGYWRIGGDSPWAGDAWFDGAIDDVAVYGDPLSSTQVSTHFNISGRGVFPAGVGDRYGSVVYSDAPTLFWRLGESSGVTAADSSGKGNSGTYSGAVTKSVPGAVPGTRNTAAQFNGTNGLVASNTTFANPQNYSLELWMKTSSTAGGKLLGFGNAQTGSSTSYDRHIYMRPDGRLVFGAYPGSTATAVSSAAYNNGQWHHIVATQSGSGMSIYVDGDLVGTNAAITAQNFTGYWRVGGDNLTSWPDAGSTHYITAAIDEVAVYGAALTSEKVKQHYAVATGAPIASFSATMSGMNGAFNADASTDLDGSIASYTWDWGDGTAAGSGARPTHSYTAPGSYDVTLTVTDNAGKTSKFTSKVTAKDVTAPTQPGTPTVSSNTGTTVVINWSASTDAVGVAGYEVFRNGVYLADSSDLMHTDRTTAVGTAYTYTVRAKDSSNNYSAQSASVAVTTRAVDTNAWYTVRSTRSNFCLTFKATADATRLEQYACSGLAEQNFKFVPTSDGYYNVSFRNRSAAVWDVSGYSTADGAFIHLYGLHNDTNQKWTPMHQGNGVYLFKSLVSGKCLDVPGGSLVEGEDMHQWTCDPANANQRFTLAVAP